MLFLIEFNPKDEETLSFQSFEDSQINEANDLRLEMELSLNRRGVRNEVVILKAESEDVIRKTHRRYFETLEDLLKTDLFNPDKYLPLRHSKV